MLRLQLAYPGAPRFDDAVEDWGDVRGQLSAGCGFLQDSFHPLDAFLDLLDRVGVRQPQVPLPRFAERRPGEDGYTTLLSGPAHPYHRHFNPAWGLNLGYDDLKVIEVYNFLHSVATGKQGEPGFAEAEAVAHVQQVMMRSWESERWESVEQ